VVLSDVRQRTDELDGSIRCRIAWYCHHAIAMLIEMIVLPRSGATMAGRRRWMLFVDGENLTIRAQNSPKNDGSYSNGFESGPLYERDVFVWLPYCRATSAMGWAGFCKDGEFGWLDYPNIKEEAERAYYYTCADGDANRLTEIKERLWSLGFHPEVFHKPRGQKAKGVDICMAKDILSHAFLGNYDVAVIVAGDKDYLPLVEEVKRIGKRVVLWFVNTGLSNELRLAADEFVSMDDRLFPVWKRYHQLKAEQEARARAKKEAEGK
jgi:hypothetical protein